MYWKRVVIFPPGFCKLSRLASLSLSSRIMGSATLSIVMIVNTLHRCLSHRRAQPKTSSSMPPHLRSGRSSLLLPVRLSMLLLMHHRKQLNGIVTKMQHSSWKTCCCPRSVSPWPEMSHGLHPFQKWDLVFNSGMTDFLLSHLSFPPNHYSDVYQ